MSQSASLTTYIYVGEDIAAVGLVRAKDMDDAERILSEHFEFPGQHPAFYLDEVDEGKFGKDGVMEFVF